MSRMKFMNTEIDNLTMQETLQAIDRLIQEDRSAYVVTPNVDHIVQLETSKELQAVYENASLILTDGKLLLCTRRLRTASVTPPVTPKIAAAPEDRPNGISSASGSICDRSIPASLQDGC